jgi:Polyketide cyclase / dehydrase and lipid transport
VSTRVDESLSIGRRRADVARYMFDWRNDPEWIGGVSEARLLTEGDFGVGSQVERVASFMGRRIEYVLQVEDYDPTSRVAMRSVKGPFPMTVEYDLGDADGGTHARIRVGGDASGFYRIAAPILNRGAARSIGEDLRRLKSLLESR